MKENRNPNIQKQTIKREVKITILVQLFVFIVMAVLGICFFFMHFLLPYLIISATLFLWLGAYNSYRYLGKKKTPIFYLLGSLFLLFQLVGF